jgi:hypothetical protein
VHVHNVDMHKAVLFDTKVCMWRGVYIVGALEVVCKLADMCTTMHTPFLVHTLVQH